MKTILLFFFIDLFAVIARCPNDCQKNGYCTDAGNCECYPSYHGIDCSMRVCPSGTAWFDEPTADNVAHGEYRECSNMVRPLSSYSSFSFDLGKL
jgi:hypothetical protein